jgi:hypothetical protein
MRREFQEIGLHFPKVHISMVSGNLDKNSEPDERDARSNDASQATWSTSICTKYRATLIDTLGKWSREKIRNAID